MNFYDSEKMSDLLMNHGYVTTDTQEDADLNYCKYLPYS